MERPAADAAADDVDSEGTLEDDAWFRQARHLLRPVGPKVVGLAARRIMKIARR